MSLDYISGNDLIKFVKAGCVNLEHNRDHVDQLNVFPVPDGDTGTNMYLTLLSAVKEGEKLKDEPLGKVAKAISMGSLMGARGNSGVILSQVFRGFAKELDGKEKANAMELARALQTGSDTAYKAVMKPVEGTILTVVREIARVCEVKAKEGNDIVATILAGVKAGYRMLDKTPSMLAILKEAGVVDAGGQGLLYFLEGAFEGLALEKDIKLDVYRESEEKTAIEKHLNQEVDLEFQYCTELLIKSENIKDDDLEDIKDHLGPLGDSMLVVGSDGIVKVHIHSNHPGKVLESCLQWGELSDIKINNMLEEVHEQMLLKEEKEKDTKRIGLVAVAAGLGVSDILKSLGVDKVVEGGQTMNPSTEDLLIACQEVNAEEVIILPNNGNIIMTAEQVIHLCDKKVSIVPTKSVMQAITALIAYDAEGEIDTVVASMQEEMQGVQYAEITQAVRDSAINGLSIISGDIIGILNGKIALKSESIEEALDGLLEKMLNDDSDLITLFYGGDINETEANKIKLNIEQKYSQCEIDMHYGGQPHYAFYLSIE